MSEGGNPIPRSFWIVGGVALVWNLIGVARYVMQLRLTEDMLAALPEAERALYTNIPAWATSAFAVAVIAGAIGSVLLLMRSVWAVPAFLISLLGVLVQMYHAFAIADAIAVLGPASALVPTLIIGIGVGLIWYARSAKEKGWLT